MFPAHLPLAVPLDAENVLHTRIPTYPPVCPPAPPTPFLGIPSNLYPFNFLLKNNIPRQRTRAQLSIKGHLGVQGTGSQVALAGGSCSLLVRAPVYLRRWQRGWRVLRRDVSVPGAQLLCGFHRCAGQGKRGGGEPGLPSPPGARGLLSRVTPGAGVREEGLQKGEI